MATAEGAGGGKTKDMKTRGAKGSGR